MGHCSFLCLSDGRWRGKLWANSARSLTFLYFSVLCVTVYVAACDFIDCYSLDLTPLLLMFLIVKPEHKYERDLHD